MVGPIFFQNQGTFLKILKKSKENSHSSLLLHACNNGPLNVVQLVFP